MNVVQHPRELDLPDRTACLAVGVFDGVHLGHQQVLRQTVLDARRYQARAVAVTFDRHPNSVVAPDHTPPLIYTLERKLRALAALGMDATLVLRFDRPFSEQSGEGFIRGLAADFGHVQSLCVGREFTFGHRRSGNVALLKTLGRELHFGLHALEAVVQDGDIVSSTRIRQAISRGDLAQAGRLLGRVYSLAARVVAGDRLGRELGFPTANLDVTGLALPPRGVYAAHALLAGRPHPAVLNIGFRPTLAPPASLIQAEAHLLDFTGHLYGAELEIVFVERLRDEETFTSREALRDQIKRDVAAARARLAERGAAGPSQNFVAAPAAPP